MTDKPEGLDVRHELARVIGSANSKTQHVYIDGNDACLAIADAILAADIFRVLPSVEADA